MPSAKLRPLLAGSDWMLSSYGRRLFLSGADWSNPRPLATLPFRLKILTWTNSEPRLVRRALRAEPSAAVNLDESRVLVALGSQFWTVDLNTGAKCLDFVVPLGRKALHIERVHSPTGLGPGHYFGEYFGNPQKEEASIWFRSDGDATWRKVFTFAAGEVNHIHSVLHDPYRDCMWILTGDLGDAAAIWQADTSWRRVTCLGSGQQMLRAAWLHIRPDCLYYATDTQLEQNFLMRVTFDGDVAAFTALSPLPGSSIYGVASGDSFFFSTAVEPGGHGKSKIGTLFSRRRGPGIRDDCAYVFELSATGNPTLVLGAPKDVWPLVLFQFGTFRLVARDPSGVYASGVAVKGLDGWTTIISPPVAQRRVAEFPIASRPDQR